MNLKIFRFFSFATLLNYLLILIVLLNLNITSAFATPTPTPKPAPGDSALDGTLVATPQACSGLDAVVRFDWDMEAGIAISQIQELWVDVAVNNNSWSAANNNTLWWGQPAITGGSVVADVSSYPTVRLTWTGGALVQGTTMFWRVNTHLFSDSDTAGSDPDDSRVWHPVPTNATFGSAGGLQVSIHNCGATPKPTPTPTIGGTPKPTPTIGGTPKPTPTVRVTQPPINIGGKEPAMICDLNDYFASVVKIITGFAGFAFFIMVIVGGYRYLTSSGDPKSADAARKIITFAVIGLVLLVLSWIILLFIQTISGASPNLTIFDICPDFT